MDPHYRFKLIDRREKSNKVLCRRENQFWNSENKIFWCKANYAKSPDNLSTSDKLLKLNTKTKIYLLKRFSNCQNQLPCRFAKDFQVNRLNFVFWSTRLKLKFDFSFLLRLLDLGLLITKHALNLTLSCYVSALACTMTRKKQDVFTAAVQFCILWHQALKQTRFKCHGRIVAVGTSHTSWSEFQLV